MKKRVILHIDVNNAFLSWTALDMLEKGSKVDIRTIPSVIGGDEQNRRGVVLAKSLGYDFTDTDLIISKKVGKKLQSIIDEDGIEYFLQAENQVGKELCCQETVVATGGSMIMNEDAVKHLKSIGKIVYINVPLATLKKRITNMKTRGIVFGKGETLDDVFANRTPLYEKYADIIINVSKSNSLEQTVNKIVKELAK